MAVHLLNRFVSEFRSRFLLGCAVLVTAGVLLATTGAVGAADAGPAPASLTPITRPGGLRPDLAAGTAGSVTGDCEVTGVHCNPVPAPRGSCTGYSSPTTAPPTIRVLVRTSATVVEVQTIAFLTYLENVLPTEWLASWDGDALKAGA